MYEPAENENAQNAKQCTTVVAALPADQTAISGDHGTYLKHLAYIRKGTFPARVLMDIVSIE